ncbi:MAG: hypothetical protein R3D62_15875 [Xanthobacteraceae bacterium]
MADYYPLIAKAVAGLEKNTGEARRTLYERARGALVAQLRSVSPALSESEITRERLALEEAIRKVEADAARRARTESAAGKRSAPPRPGEPGGPSRAGDQDRGREADLAGSAEGEPAGSRPPGGRRGLGNRDALRDQGLKGFRDVVADTESLGDATAQASKSAREAFAAASPTRDAPRMEPHMEPDELRPPPRRPSRPPMREPGAVPPDDEGPRKGEPPLLREAARGEPPKLGGRERAPWIGRSREPLESPPGPPLPSGILPDEEPGHDFAPRERGQPPYRDYGGEDEAGDRPFPHGPTETREETGGGLAGALSRIFSNRSVLVAAAAAILALCLAGILYWQWPTISGMFKSSDVATAPSSPTTPAPASSSKLTDRIGAPGASSESQTGEGANVAQRVVLYEEDPGNTAGKRHVGTVIWRLESAAAGPGQAAEPVIRADIEIPDPHITVKWSLRRNTDKALPASHTIEIVFTLPPDFPNGAIANIPGILMKQAEQTRGIPLAGLSVKVTEGFFLIGLSSTEIDVKRNIQLLKERAWFDIPIVYSNNRRAILALEKGNPGDLVFDEAFKAWGE